MRTFHTGGIAGSDITQGLPRIEEIFEARRPKKTAILCEYEGTAHIIPDKRINKIVISIPGVPEEEWPAYEVPFGGHILVEDNTPVLRGQALTEGSLSPADILRIKNDVNDVYDYIIREVQRVYRGENVEINDKHIEVIARQMTRKCKVEVSGDTELLEGTVIDISEFENANEEIQARIDAGERDLVLAERSPVLLGITKASLLTESFLSAASFQETTRVLTEAAINGKTDHLLGLKENVIIGKLIPAGTGLEMYQNVEVRSHRKATEEADDASDIADAVEADSEESALDNSEVAVNEEMAETVSVQE